MDIKILGTGCPKCTQLYENTQAALKTAGIDATIGKVSNINDIMTYGVMITPAIVVDGEVKSSGKLCTPEEIMNFLK